MSITEELSNYSSMIFYCIQPHHNTRNEQNFSSLSQGLIYFGLAPGTRLNEFRKSGRVALSSDILSSPMTDLDTAFTMHQNALEILYPKLSV